MLCIVSFGLSFISGTCIGHTLQCLCPLQQIIAHHFCDPLMDDKNLIIEAQVVKALFALQILDSVQALLHQHC